MCSEAAEMFCGLCAGEDGMGWGGCDDRALAEEEAVVTLALCGRPEGLIRWGRETVEALAGLGRAELAAIWRRPVRS